MYGSSTPELLLSHDLAIDGEIDVAVDTEYQGTHTLTVQAAARIGPHTLAVQLYRSPAVPGLPAGFEVEKYLPPERYGQFFRGIVVRPVKPLSADLSPMRMIADLFDLDGIEILTRAEGRGLIDGFGTPDEPGPAVRPENAVWQPRKQRWKLPRLTVTLVGHYLRADLARLFGRDFTAGLLAEDIALASTGKQLRFVERGDRRNLPVLEYARGAGLHEVKVATRDTQLIAGSGSLDKLCKAFLGFSKCDALSESDKADMLATFGRRTADAYGYAITDAVNTLLVYERMAEADRDIYRAFGFAEDDIPPLHGTLGRRVSRFVMRSAWRHVGESASLDRPSALEGLMRGGGLALFEDHRDASRYGRQTGQVHGGQLFSRSPIRFYHESRGRLRDVDLGGAYPAIASKISLYAGRPVVLEPGGRQVFLKDAVDLVSRWAPRDGWLVRVSGDIRGFLNALLPSQDDAVTSLNYATAMRNGRRRNSRRRAFHLEALRDPASVKGTVGTRLYSSVVESGVVTWATWQVIQALPASAREQYERLAADSIIFYPSKLVAKDGPEFDALVERHRVEGLPWEEELDLDAMEMVRHEKIDHRFISLQVPLGEYAAGLVAFRKEALARDGKGGAERTWKDYANTLYGVLASSYHPCNNVVAANVITAWARAEAFAMAMSLNAVQTITDGCTWRADQAPALSFEECLRLKTDYPLRRAEGSDGVPFLDPAKVPVEDEAFTAWYRGHAKRFFGEPGPGFDEVIGTHAVVHKKTTGTDLPTFDALACDGAANYAKVVIDADGNKRVTDFMARSFKPGSKAAVQDWLVKSYSGNRLEEPAPLATDTDLVSHGRAMQLARKALESGYGEVIFPLGLEENKAKNYKALKMSAFVFRTPAQRAGILKQVRKFEKRTGCGLEVLALRRGYRGRRQGSLADLAEAIHTLIRSGEENLGAALNLGRLSAELKELCRDRLDDLDWRRRESRRRLFEAIDAGRLDPDALATALVLTANHLALLGGRRQATALSV